MYTCIVEVGTLIEKQTEVCKLWVLGGICHWAVLLGSMCACCSALALCRQGWCPASCTWYPRSFHSGRGLCSQVTVLILIFAISYNHCKLLEDNKSGAEAGLLLLLASVSSHSHHRRGEGRPVSTAISFFTDISTLSLWSSLKLNSSSLGAGEGRISSVSFLPSSMPIVTYRGQYSN